jgi:hypothetical protein
VGCALVKRQPASQQKVSMKQGRSIATLVAVCTALIGLGAGRVAADGPKAAGPKVVIELFTSQGCSSCPAADKLLGELAKDSSILPMSLSVDYWDYLGWKDTLALPGHAKRQRAYAGNRGDRAVYTPQAVINGATRRSPTASCKSIFRRQSSPASPAKSGCARFQSRCR